MSDQHERPSLPPDALSLQGEEFTGRGYVYRGPLTNLQVVEVPLDGPRRKPVTPFRYNKPIANPEDPLLPPDEFRLDQQAREGCIPLAFVEGARRPPNHLYEEDDAVFIAVNMGTEENPHWETRYFPKNSLEKSVWDEVMRLLGVTE